MRLRTMLVNTLELCKSGKRFAVAAVLAAAVSAFAFAVAVAFDVVVAIWYLRENLLCALSLT